MSLLLSRTGAVAKAHADVLLLGDLEIPADEFCDLVRYFVTNTNLLDGDQRLRLLDDLRCARFADGYPSSAQGGVRVVLLSEPGFAVVHVLHHGEAYCGAGAPSRWPGSDRWVRRGEHGATCDACAAIGRARD